MLHRLNAVWPSCFWAAHIRTRSGRDWSLAARVAVVLVALIILYLRMPESFLHPQLYAEDNDFLYKTRADGWTSLSSVIAGWLAIVQFLVAMLASYFSAALAPDIFYYAAVALTLLVVWMVMSPRLDMPYKPLLAFAVVVVPMGYEELGTLTNIQWILPIGGFALLFTRPSAAPIVLVGEAVFLAVTALSGPFAIFYTPMYLWRLARAQESVERHRLVVLTAIAGIGALIQVSVLALHPSVLNLVAPTPYSWTVWVNLPFTQFMTTFGPASDLFRGTSGAVLGLILLATAAVLSWLPPYRTQKLFMLFFALAIAVSGMYKFRAALETQYSSQRYFYAGSVLALWFVCCLSDRCYLRTLFVALVALTELMLLPKVANTPRFAEDLEWPVWASYLPSGLPIIIPNTPSGFFLSLPATPNGPLAQFAHWLGRPLSELGGQTDTSACQGVLDPVESAGMIYLQPVRDSKDLWVTRGTAWDGTRNRPVQLVVLVDSSTDRVTGFGLPGFRNKAEPHLARSAWKSTFYADSGTTIRAYGILDDGQRICPLANLRSFPLVAKPLASDEFAGAVEVLPGREISQRFKPVQRLEEMSLRLVTWGRIPSRYTLEWRIVATSRSQTLELGVGTIDAAIIRDWQRLTLPVAVVFDEVPDQIEVTFRTDAVRPPAAPLGLPLYKPAAGTEAPPPAVVDGTPVPSGALIGLSPAYAQ